MKADPDRASPRDPREARHATGLRFPLARRVGCVYAALLDLIFPPRCACCGQIDTPLCAACAADLLHPDLSLLPSIPHLTAGAASGAYEGKLRSAIHAFKYESDLPTALQIADPLGARLAECFERLNWRIDMVIPVPLHPSRQRERGYNQSKLLGERMAAPFHLPIEEKALIRQRRAASQVGQSRAERQTSLHNAVYAPSSRISGCAVLLIDDVCTTGATLSECARAALVAGAVSVFALTLARA